MTSQQFMITREQVEDRAIRLVDVSVMEQPDLRWAWKHPEYRLLMLNGIKLGVAAAFEAVAEAQAGQS